jgi:hypothetical protein
MGKPLFCALIDSTAASPKTKQACMGIKVNKWKRAKMRRYYLDEFR